nr:MAG TPA: hypothetical protein [Caudoviricetes sp.]
MMKILQGGALCTGSQFEPVLNAVRCTLQH